jgi:cell division protein FtsB
MTDTEREQLRLILQLQAKVAALEDENTALKATVADLQKRLDDLAGEDAV